MKQNLVTKNLILFLLLVNSCSTSKQSIDDETYKVIDLEMNRTIYSSKNDSKITLDFTLNNTLINFIKEQTKDSTYKNVLKNKIGNTIFDQHFYTKESHHFIEQLKFDTINKSKIALPKHVFFDTNKNNTTIDRLIESPKYRISLSNPIFTSDEKHALISYSNGYEGSMVGGISVYKKKGSNWFYYTSINEWME